MGGLNRLSSHPDGDDVRALVVDSPRLPLGHVVAVAGRVVVVASDLVTHLAESRHPVHNEGLDVRVDLPDAVRLDEVSERLGSRNGLFI